MTELGAVWEITSDGRGGGSSRLVHAAGSPEAAAFHAKYGDPEHPVELEAAGPFYGQGGNGQSDNDDAEITVPLEDTDPDYDETNDEPDEDVPIDLPEATDDPEPMQADAQ